jgi:hypothetical protein
MYLYMFSPLETVLWSGLKRGPPRRLKFPDPSSLIELLKVALAWGGLCNCFIFYRLVYYSNVFFMCYLQSSETNFYIFESDRELIQRQ